MRSLNSFRNAIIAIFYELMIVAFGLVVPKLITTTYGSDINGLTSTVNNVLQILNLLQAGAVGASIFQMFKPVAEKDYEKISVIMDSTRKFFCRVGVIFLILVFIISPVFGLFVKGGGVSFWEKFLAFLILGINGAVYIFFITYFDVLFSSHQQRFVLSVCAIVGKAVYYVLVIAIALLRLPYLLLYAATVVGTLIDVLLLYIVYLKRYKPLIKKVPKNNAFKIPNRIYLFINQIAIQGIMSMPIVLASLVGDLNAASVLSYYYLVFNMVKMVLYTMQLSVGEVFGNFIVSKNEGEIKKVFNLLDFIFAVVGTFLCVCSAFLFSAFINVYTNANTLTDSTGAWVDYMYSSLPIMLSLLLIFYALKMPYYMLTNVYGYYKETYLQSAIFSVAGILLSVGLSFIDWTFVVIGPIFFYLATYIYRMVVAKRRLSWLSVFNTMRRICVIITFTAAAFIASYFFYENGYPKTYGAWILQAIITALCAIAAIGAYIAAFERDEFKETVKYGKAILFRKRKAGGKDNA